MLLRKFDLHLDPQIPDRYDLRKCAFAGFQALALHTGQKEVLKDISRGTDWCQCLAERAYFMPIVTTWEQRRWSPG